MKASSIVYPRRYAAAVGGMVYVIPYSTAPPYLLTDAICVTADVGQTAAEAGDRSTSEGFTQRLDADD